jgi:hypothetical protein
VIETRDTSNHMSTDQQAVREGAGDRAKCWPTRDVRPTRSALSEGRALNGDRDGASPAWGTDDDGTDASAPHHCTNGADADG